jgi:superfamily II DNA or RNA helicase
MLSAGMIVKGPYWAETVEIKKCEYIDDDLYLVESIGRTTQKFYEQWLDANELRKIEFLQTSEKNSQLTANELQHLLQFHILKVEQGYSVSRMRGNKQLIPLPHQIEAVYSRMLQSPQIRFLLADDPGAGKTIMSGMLIRELLARRSAERILILVPPLVLTQWQEELKEKFGEEFTIVTRATLFAANGNNPFEQYSKCIASLYWAARDDVKSYLFEANFDLVIVDEAHKMAAYTHGIKKKKIQRTKLYQLGEGILRHVEHCLLLTATPHKGDLENYRHLMSLVDHDIFSNLTQDDSIREHSNPFVIRRLKENMVNFDGTPLFPKRTTQTIGYDLTDDELELYEEVTSYAREYFNRAISKNSQSTAFAMMLLQRRLSSSIEAIHLSLERRRDRLEDLMKNELKNYRIASVADYEELTVEEQLEYESEVEGATDALNLDELQMEIDELNRLLQKTAKLRSHGFEKKYLELENTLFGKNALLQQDEKILIFTESTDTLYSLEKRLLARVPKIAKITGKHTMEQRREQVEFFREHCQVMLATDAGGESINLQFCNQMINYDIPWNPNKLEQRMGRIHRIGQRNEVFVFNLVARNTREGDVMKRLLLKMEQMRNDLGQEVVYDFIGDILEDESADLAKLMQAALYQREYLDDIIWKMEKVISEEHQRLLDLAKSERLDDSSFDLPGLRRNYNDSIAISLPARVYSDFTRKELESTRIRVYHSSREDITRIERIPKMMKEYARKNGIPLQNDTSYRFTGNPDLVTVEGVQWVQSNHPLFQLALLHSSQKIDLLALENYTVCYPTPEVLDVEIHEIKIVDGTGRELHHECIHLARRADGSFIRCNSNWLFSALFASDNPFLDRNSGSDFKIQIIREAKSRLVMTKANRDAQLMKKTQFLKRSFEAQYETLLKRLNKYQIDNIGNKNSALINQTISQMEELEERRDVRLSEMERERSIQLKPARKLAMIRVIPSKEHAVTRLFPSDYVDLIKRYEISNGRPNVKVFDVFSLVDFYSEDADGEGRFIIVLKSIHKKEMFNVADYASISNHTYVYLINGDRFEEITLQSWLGIKR